MISFRTQNALPIFGFLLLLAGCIAPAERSNQNNNSSTGTGGSGAGGASGAAGAGGASGAAETGGAGGVAGTLSATGGMGGSAAVGAGGAGGSGTGGAAGASTGGAGAAGAGASGSGGNDSAIDVGNYFKSGAWMGYVWTSVTGEGSTITPMDFEAQTTGMPRCVSGTVAPSADFSNVALLGFNLNEPSGGMGTAVAPTMAGVTINVTNRAGSPLRLQVQTTSTGGTQWCTNVIGSGGFILWEALRTACWGSTGMRYNREPIVAAMLLVPGDDTMPVDFDFCVDALAEADQMTAGTGGMGSTGGTGGADAGGDPADAGM